jgi:hypothetical protein
MGFARSGWRPHAAATVTFGVHLSGGLASYDKRVRCAVEPGAPPLSEGSSKGALQLGQVVKLSGQAAECPSAWGLRSRRPPSAS